MIVNDFGMPTLIENKTLQENIDLCTSLGLKFIELNMNFPEYQIDKLEDYKIFYEAADKAGIYYTIHLDETLNVADFNPLIRDAYLETVRRVIDVSKKLLPLSKKYGKTEINLSERLMIAEKTGSRCVLETKTIEALKQSVNWIRQNY